MDAIAVLAVLLYIASAVLLIFALLTWVKGRTE